MGACAKANRTLKDEYTSETASYCTEHAPAAGCRLRRWRHAARVVPLSAVTARWRAGARWSQWVVRRSATASVNKVKVSGQSQRRGWAGNTQLLQRWRQMKCIKYQRNLWNWKWVQETYTNQQLKQKKNNMTSSLWRRSRLAYLDLLRERRSLDERRRERSSEYLPTQTSVSWRLGLCIVLCCIQSC